MKTTMKRAVHIDFHTMPKIDDFGANYGPVDLAEMLADAHFSCYFSKVSPSALDCPEPIVVLESGTENI